MCLLSQIWEFFLMTYVYFPTSASKNRRNEVAPYAHCHQSVSCIIWSINNRIWTAMWGASLLHHQLVPWSLWGRVLPLPITHSHNLVCALCQQIFITDCSTRFRNHSSSGVSVNPDGYKIAGALHNLTYTPRQSFGLFIEISVMTIGKRKQL